ncbi:sarcosine oxidase subunit gamma [Rhodobacterales bacterium HKCCE2091]|nr:sarcosine oxidase subunit gamma [Rhodobacterales bacterium HKCCE2091]
MRHGNCAAAPFQPDAITSVAPYPGQEAAVSAALKDRIGAPFPAPGRSTTGADGSLAAWSGLDQCFVFGPALDAIDGAAVTDQSDAWAGIEIVGEDAREVLARLSPLDLRPGVFEPGHTARSLIGHMPALIMRTGDAVYLLLVFRSMAATAAHEIETAMKGVAARASLAT